MNSTFKRLMSMMLVLCMLLVAFASCTPADDDSEDSKGDDGQVDVTDAKVGSYTYNTYASALGTNWNPHTWELNSDDSILSMVSSPFCTMQVLDSENGIYQWVYEMAESVTDVTADHKDDLTKYNVTLAEGQTVEDVNSGYVFEIKLNPNAKWENGTVINADSYIYSMKAFLDPAMKNYRANLYYSGESAVAGGYEYYYAGSTAYDTDLEGAETFDTIVLRDDGTYTTSDGKPLAIAVGVELAWLGGYALSDYVDAYGANYFDVESYKKLQEKASSGFVAVTDETISLLEAVITYSADWGETRDNVPNYFYSGVDMPECSYDSVGCYKVDDYTIRYVCDAYIDINYFLTSCTSTWLVYEELYEAGKDTTGSLVTTNYSTSPETTMSYGPYKIESMQDDKQLVYVQNENWYGYEKVTGADGNEYLVSYTPYLVDGEHVQRYMTTKYVVNVMEDDAAKLSFLKGDLDDWSVSADDLPTYTMSENLYKVDETYTMSFFFNTDVDALKEMDNSKGNTNSVVLSNYNFRKAFSRAIDREKYVTATEGYKPAYSLMNKLYHYDIYNDPTSSYRSSEEAMQAICNLYGVEYGEGTPYATLKEAYESINGYNLTEAKELMKTACDELVAAGLYTAGEDVYIRIGWAKGTLSSADNNQVTLMNEFINAAAEGSGFGKITFEAVGSIEDRYNDVPNGNFAVGYGAWGGAAFYPFRNMQVYCDTEEYAGKINERADWDPSTEELTINLNGEDVTMTWQDWSRACVGTGAYASADNKIKLQITATMEEKFLEKYYRIPLAGTAVCSMLSYKISYYTDEYNIMYGFGGLELLDYNYTDAEWAEFVASNNGQLSYE